MRNLVIVESPSKATTINSYLGKDYKVLASVGHVRDLPKSTLGVDIEHDFKLKYINIKGTSELINQLKKESKAAVAAPTIQDQIVGAVGHEIKKGYRQVRTCISSGMIARIDCWRKVGGYDEYLFIDSVDFDFCYGSNGKDDWQLTDDDFQGETFDDLKMVMLAASYPDVLNNSPYLQECVDLTENDPEKLIGFRNWNDFDYRIDWSVRREPPGVLIAGLLTIRDRRTGEDVWNVIV